MSLITTKDPHFSLRFATPDDAGHVVDIMTIYRSAPEQQHRHFRPRPGLHGHERVLQQPRRRRYLARADRALVLQKGQVVLQGTADEVCALSTHSKQKAFFAWAAKAQELGYLRIESPPADAVHALWQMMDKYEDLPMDFCDASLVYLASSLKIHRIATTDLKDFSVYRLPGNKRFTHVLDE